jgi:hypothetical protein
MSLIFHPLVQRDINVAIRYYDEEGGISLGDRFYAELNRILKHIEASPPWFHIYSGEIRRANLTGFPYHILFKLTTRGARILVIRHHKRNPLLGLTRR